MKFKLESFIKDHRVTPHNPNGKPENLEDGQRSGTIQKRVEKIVIDAGCKGVTVQDVAEHTGLKPEQVINAINRNPNIHLTPIYKECGKKRYHYEV
ncbi:hypothetical protein [Vibrio phage Artemius]|nr:hypothetical protein [Vibrio phage Artemius]